MPVSTPGGHVDVERLLAVDPPLAAAVAAWAFDHLAAAVAVGAGALDHEEALLGADLAVARSTGCSGARRCRGRARAVARLAGLADLDLDLARLAVERLVEADLHVVAQVGAAARLLPPAAERAAEDGLEDVAEIAEVAALVAARPAHRRRKRHGRSGRMPRASAGP